MNLASQLERALPADHLQYVRQAAAIATSQGKPIWLVGGPVRDLILERPVTDLDLVIEGEAPAVASAFAAATAGKLTTHAAFGTATVLLGAFSIDFVTARSETYPQPAVLPVVTPATISADLRRRDFTINTLALSLAPETWGEVLDLLAGLADLEAKLVRVLHPRSFVDDPTRVLRAARFAGRLGYVIEPQTLAAMEAARPYIGQTSPARILHELYLLRHEPLPEQALLWLDRVGAREPLYITWQPSWGRDAMRNVRAAPLGDVAAHVLLGLLAPGELQWTTYYPLTSGEQRMFKQVGQVLDLIPQLAQPALDDGELDRLLQPFDPAAIWVVRFGPLVNADAPLAARLTHYLTDVRSRPTLLNGDDLRRLGFPPGPRYRQLLADLRAAQLRGELQTTAQAEQWCRNQAEKD